MDNISRRRKLTSRQRRSWCCTFTVPPSSPDSLANRKLSSRPLNKLDSSSKPTSVPSLVGRILSPGRVSPIDSSPIQLLGPAPSPPPPAVVFPVATGVFDVRLNLRGKRGGGLVLELNSEVLSSNSELFAGLISEYRKSGAGSSSSSSGVCSRLESLELLMCLRYLLASCSRRVSSCLKYLEAVPWTEEEEEKLRNLFTRFKFDKATTRDILARLYLLDSVDSQQNLSRQLVSSITTCTDVNARHELKLLVKGLLCRSSVYEKDHHDLNKEDIYGVCRSCLSSLVSLFEEATGNISHQKTGKETGKPMIERVSRQVDNINWLLDILLDRQMAEDFVDIWAEQGELLKMHADTSPMVRYEPSRVSAILFVAMGTRKLQCRSESRSGLLQAWFGPTLLDFGWLQRCRKGLDIKSLEEALGQTLLTLPLKQQYMLFMEWFQYFSKHSTDCPNLSKAFQIWWRRSFLSGSETSAIESR
ncbi:hypothetical protein ACLB2K_007603 [Fragaria x ananassa]